MISRSFTLKNMLSRSCIKLIELSFRDLKGVELRHISIGHVDLDHDNKVIAEPDLLRTFEDLGFPVILNLEMELVEKAKHAAIELVHFSFNSSSLIRNSDYISDKLQVPYEKISKLFSNETGLTLEKYIILLKIEKAKELIVNNQHTLSEISYMLGYSSVQYLSNQFKKVTGSTVSEFKDNPVVVRRPLEELLS